MEWRVIWWFPPPQVLTVHDGDYCRNPVLSICASVSQAPLQSSTKSKNAQRLFVFHAVVWSGILESPEERYLIISNHFNDLGQAFDWSLKPTCALFLAIEKKYQTKGEIKHLETTFVCQFHSGTGWYSCWQLLLHRSHIPRNWCMWWFFIGLKCLAFHQNIISPHYQV